MQENTQEHLFSEEKVIYGSKGEIDTVNLEKIFMEPDKYFTPDIEDIYIGYECEIQNGEGVWVNKIINFEYGWIELPEEYNERLRTPYLTKEQIESKGWKLRLDKLYYHQSDHGGYLLKQQPNNQIEITDSFDAEYIYRGGCKDINTFKQICKLLKIN